MKRVLIYFLSIFLMVVTVPFIAHNSIAKSCEIFISVFNDNGLIEDIELEEYVLSVLAAREDIVSSLEAKKAFAVAVRSIGMYFATFGCKHTEFDACTDDNCCISIAKSENASETTINAVRETKGQFLSIDDTPTMALFSVCASSGTRQNKEFPYLVPIVSSGQCEKHKFEKTFTADELFNLFPFASGVDSFYTVYGENNKIEFAIFGGKQISSESLTSSFGLKSVEFTVLPNGNGIDIKAYGIGEGYGLDLCNAEKLAKNGMYYQKILEIFFPQLKIKQI